MSTSTSTAPVETARQMYEAFGRGDVQAIPDRVTDDVDWSTDAERSPGHRGGVTVLPGPRP
jgi:ketosteroid isomerase-like protein